MPPGILLLIYLLLGGLALFMFLMGIFTILAFLLYIFNVYFNFEEEVENPLKINLKRDALVTRREKSLQEQDLNIDEQLVLAQVQTDERLRIAAFESTIAQKPRESQISTIKSTGIDATISSPFSEEFSNNDFPQNENNWSTNKESFQLIQDLQNNPFLNLSPDRLKKLKDSDIFDKNLTGLGDRLNEAIRMPHCKCNLEKDNFKIIIKAKSQRIVSFLTHLQQFYLDLMKSEQLCGRNFSKLGQPTISLIGQFKEPILFKETLLDDHISMIQSKAAIKTDYAFCKWKLIRKVFNEIGVCHVENALFYREGVLATISALSDTVQNSVKGYQQKHIILCEELDKTEKRLLKMKNEYSKSNEIVQEAISNYTKAQQTIKNYEKVLELEMKFKLCYKQMQDNASKVSDALDSMCETREKFQKETQSMLIDLKGLDRNKIEIFKSTLMSVVDTHYDFEIQIQSFFEECLKQSIQIKNQLKSQTNNLSQVSNSNSGNGASISNEEEDFLKLQKKRSLKYKVEEVQNLMDELAVDEIDNELMIDDNNKFLEVFEKYNADSDDSLTVNDEDHSIAMIRSEANKPQFKDFSRINDYLSSDLQRAQEVKSQTDGKLLFMDDDQISINFQPNLIQSPQTSNNMSLSIFRGSPHINPEKLDLSDIEKLLQTHQTKSDQQSRQTQLMIEGIKDLIMYLKQMKEIIQKYYEHHTQAIENQFEEVRHITSQNNDIFNSPSILEPANNKIKQLKLLKSQNDSIHKIWQSFISNFKSFLHQYELLVQKLTGIEQNLNIYLTQIQQQKDMTTNQLKQQTNILRTQLTRVKQSIAQLKYIKQQKQQIQESSMTQNDKGNKNYYQQYENMKLIIQNPQPILKIAYSGNLPSEDHTKELVTQQYHIMTDTQTRFLEQYKLYSQDMLQIQKVIKDKIINIKNELVQSHKERSKNSQVFFQNVMNSIENQIGSFDSESIVDDDFNQEIIAHENNLNNNNKTLGHKQGCIYYANENKQVTPINSNNNEIKTSPEKKTIQNLTHNKKKEHLFFHQMSASNEEFKHSIPNLIQQVSNKSSKDANVESAQWFNKALEVFYNEWKTSEVFQNFLLKEIYIVANKNRNKMLSEIEVNKIVLHGKAPEFLKIQKLDSNPNDFLYDIDLSLRGTVEVLIKTVININWKLNSFYKIPLTVNVILRSVNGKLRVFFSNDKTKGCWYGFVGKPVIKFNLDPIIGKDNQFSIKYIPKLRQLIEELIGKSFDKYCLPNKRPLSIPLTKQTNTVWPRLVKQVDKCIGVSLTDFLPSPIGSRTTSFVTQMNPGNQQSQLSQQFLDPLLLNIQQRQGMSRQSSASDISKKDNSKNQNDKMKFD